MTAPTSNDGTEEKVFKLANRAILTATLLATLTVAAEAANPPFCNGYADTAVAQVRIARSHVGCAAGAVGTRWSPNRPFHYNWCLGADPRAADHERHEREAFLRGCGGIR